MTFGRCSAKPQLRRLNVVWSEMRRSCREHPSAARGEALGLGQGKMENKP